MKKFRRFSAFFLCLCILLSSMHIVLAETLAITKQPRNVAVPEGSVASTSVTAVGDGLKYQWYYANAGASSFSKASITSATYSVEMTASRSGRRIYCVVTDSAGDSVQSDTVTLSLAKPLAITKQPQNVTVAAGEMATASVAATGDGLKYQWYYANKGASSFSKASITSATYSVEMTESRSGRRIYCVVTDQYGNKVQSDTVTLSVKTAAELKITKQPQNVSVAAGETASTSVTATGDGLKYQWYYANKGASTFSKASITSATYSVEMTASRSGRRIYCVVTDQYGNKVQTDTVTLSVKTAAELKITQQPQNVSVAAGKTASTSVTATGEGLKYQWYYANKGATAFSKASITSATYSVEMTASRSGRRIYCVVTDAAGNKVQSDTVTLTLKASELKITQQPKDTAVKAGETAKVTVIAEGEGLTYAWYYANKGSSTFKKGSITTNTYTVEMDASRSGRRIYCVVTDAKGNSVQTDTVTLTVAAGELKITKQPEDVAVAVGETAKVTVEAEGEGLTYAWYYANPGSSTFKKGSIVTNVYTVEMTESRSGRRIYCLVTDAKGNSVQTDTVTLTVGEPIPEGLTWEISNDKVTITGYTGSATSLKIPSKIEGCPVTVIGSGAFKGNTALKSITLPNSITKIGSQAFYGCSSLSSMNTY